LSLQYTWTKNYMTIILTHELQSLRRWELLSLTRNYLPFMEPKISLPCLLD